ncbi:hypothetical protein [Rhodohalobacter halophilus]|uniref:hypothetical protein n=1 Tax=Rhodohalobacter halophilus TaxID=1812810 RepID=UPI00083F584E|nr:hypothetical protein [Rhodohalobacter halophilus]
MKTNKFWIVIILLSLAFSFFVNLKHFQQTTFDMAIASLLGYLLALLAIPAILSFIVGGVYKIFGGSFDKTSFKWTFLVAWLLIGFLNLIGNLAS